MNSCLTLVMLEIVLAFGVCAFVLHGGSLIKCITLSITLFVNHYIIVSGVLFALDSFAIWKVLVCVLALEITENIVLIVSRKKGENKYKFTFSFKEFILIVVTLLILYPIAAQRNGYFCMSQDEGGYYVKALYLLADNNANVQEIKELELISNEEYLDFFESAISEWVVGFESPNKDLQYTNSEYVKNLYNIYEDGLYGRSHAIYTFPALLALFGKIAGVQRMGYIQLIFYYIYIVIVFFALQNLKIKPILAEIMTISCGLIPIVVWTEKSFLTEPYLSVLMAVIILLLLEKSQNGKAFACIYMGTMSFYHVTAFVFAPLFVITYIILFEATKIKKYLKSAIVVMLMYWCGFVVSLIPNPSYTVTNVSAHLDFLNIYNIEMLVSLVSILCVMVIFTVLLIIKSHKISNILDCIWEKLICTHGIIIKNVITILLLLLNIKNIVQCENWEQNVLIAYIAFTGGFVFAFIIEDLISHKNEFNIERNIMWIYFIYAILVMALIMNTINSYYYYSRYYAPYAFVVFVYAASVFNQRESRYYFNVLLCLFGIKHMLVYDSVLAKYQDDTCYQVDALQEIMECINEGQIVIISDVGYHEFGALYVPLRLENAYIFPMQDSIEYTLSQIEFDEDDEIVFISWDEPQEEYNYELIEIVDNYFSLLRDYKNIYSDMFLNADETNVKQYYARYQQQIYIYSYKNGRENE